MEVFNGKLKALAGEVRTWQELLIVAINARTYSADAPTNTKLRAQMRDRFRAAVITIHRFVPVNDIFIISAYKGNTNGTIDQAAWTLPGDVTDAAAGAGAEHQGGVEFTRTYRVGSASEAVYAAADTLIEVSISVE